MRALRDVSSHDNEGRYMKPRDRSVLSAMVICTLAVIAFLVLYVQGRRVSEPELVGRYSAVYQFGSEVLVLDTGGAYMQVLRLHDEIDSVVHRGRWYKSSAIISVPLESEAVVLVNGQLFRDLQGEMNPDFRRPFDGLIFLGISRFMPWEEIRLGSDEGVQLKRHSVNGKN